MPKAYLVLADGTVYEGDGFGASCDSIGELVFTTGMEGYLETLTDESYAGQIILQTFPLIGNYGVIEQDFEGECSARGYVVHEWCDAPSNFRSQGDLDAFLKAHGIPGICGLDTRAITRRIREHGVINAMICREVPKDLSAVQGYAVRGVVNQVTCKEKNEYPAIGETKYHVALMDYGAKRNIVRELQKRGCSVTVYPANTPAETVLESHPDGVMLSNGPGDPEENTFCIAQIAKMLGKVPMFGICLGHQMTALAAGGRTEKMKYGHRGANQPVKEVNGVRCYITSQNHGYAVVSESVHTGKISYVNANDGSCEGIDYPDLNAFTVQFHPEASAGPHDTAFLFDRFIAMMGGEKVCR